MFKAVGNLFHRSDSLSFSQEDQTFVALYVKDAHTAYRIRARIGYHSNVADNKVPDDNSAGAQVTDSWKENKFDITLGFGIQKSRGKGRLRGIYGGEFDFMYRSDKSTFSYANKFSQTNLTPTSTNWDSLITPGVYTYGNPASRLVSYNQGSGVAFGVN